MYQTIAIALGATLVVTIALVYLYVRRQSSQLNDREFHIWFQKAFMGMTRREIQGLPDRSSSKKPAVREESPARG